MNLTDYLDIYQLASRKGVDHEENRAFGLEHEKLSSIGKLQEWGNRHVVSLGADRMSDILGRYLYGIDMTTGIMAFIFGFATGAALLSYSGSEPVNVVYFLAVAVALPVLTMVLALFALIRIDTPHHTLVHLSPAYWMERLLRLLGAKGEKYRQLGRIDPKITNYMILKRSQVLGLIFSIGLLVSLLLMVSTRDIAFGWSTTLHISPESFHAFLDKLALPWRSIAPWAVPSPELIEHSRFFRLGGHISGDMIQNVSGLGEWWKFLAMATLVYAVGLRVVMWLIVSVGFGRALEGSLLSLPEVASILWEMDTPVLQSVSQETEPAFSPGKNNYRQTTYKLDERYSAAVGWAIKKEPLLSLIDSLNISTDRVESAGGLNSIDDDRKRAGNLTGSVVLLVKCWEPPTNDFIDFLSDMLAHAKRVTIVPAGTVADRYKCDPKDIDIWSRKLSEITDRRLLLFAKYLTI
jgi:hypothetical protein